MSMVFLQIPISGFNIYFHEKIVYLNIITIVLKGIYYDFLHGFKGSYTRRILLEALDLLGQLWPYLVAGILFTVLVKLFVSKKMIAEFFHYNSNLSILMAAVIGVLSPLGSYVIIPLSAALFTVGLPLPVLMTLLIASPLITPNLYFLTAGAFGHEMAVARLLSSFLLGLAGGYLTVWAVNKKWIITDKVLKATGQHHISGFETGTDRGLWKEFWYDLYRMARYVSRYFFLAIILAAAIKIFVSPNWIIRYLGSNDFFTVLLTTAAGVPFYVCGGAAIPVMQQLAEFGMTKGAVLAFFISGPATKVSSLVLVYGIFQKKIFAVYFTVGIIGAFLLGLLYNMY